MKSVKKNCKWADDMLSSYESYKWVGVDLDGTLADNSAHTSGLGAIGKPITKMCNRVKRMHKQGVMVKIFTARVSDVGEENKERLQAHIWKWCDKALGFHPEITNSKDGMMGTLYDDRAKQVQTNTGVVIEDRLKQLEQLLIETMPYVKTKNTTLWNKINKATNGVR